MKRFPFILATMFLTGCSYSLTNVITEGQASDVGDDTNTPTANVSPTVTVPVSPLTGL